jgi:hypothetical protein
MFGRSFHAFAVQTKDRKQMANRMTHAEIAQALLAGDQEEHDEAKRLLDAMEPEEREKFRAMWNAAFEDIVSEDKDKKVRERVDRIKATAWRQYFEQQPGRPPAGPGRLHRDERALLARQYDNNAPSGDIVRASRRGAVLEMPMHAPSPGQIRARIEELEAELAAHRAAFMGAR